MSRALLFFSTLAATTAISAGNGYDGRMDLYTGWRQDDFDWSIQGRHGDPNVFAEVDWTENQMVMVGGRGYLAGWDKIFIKAQGDYAKTIQSKPIYSVYAFDNRNGLFSREEACQTGKRAFDYKAALGFHILPNCGPFDVAFMAGYAFQALTLKFKNPRVIVSPITSREFSAQGVRMNQMIHWESGYLGIDGMWNISKCWSFTVQGEVHYAAYKGRGRYRWHEPDFDRHRLPFDRNFDHRRQHFDVKWYDCASGWGEVISGTATYNAGQGWYFGVLGGFQRFWTREGDYAINFLDRHVNPALHYAVTFPTEAATLNKIVWRSFYVCFNFECHF